MTPEALIAMLAERNIHLEDQPRVFESIIPPDRRRFYSQPGGLPSAETLWNEFGSRSIVELEGEDLASELAQQLLTGKNILIDVSARLGCFCSGAVVGAEPKDARANVVALEPPRSTMASGSRQPFPWIYRYRRHHAHRSMSLPYRIRARRQRRWSSHRQTAQCRSRIASVLCADSRR